MSKVLRSALIGIGALGLSTIGIFASDMMQGIDSGVGNLAALNSAGNCPQGMVLYKGSAMTICVDMYEASVPESCPLRDPKNVIESEKNASTNGCYAASVEEAAPWTYITLSQAQRVCAMSGKRLPTSDEWYMIALGTNGEECNVNGNAPRNAMGSGCVSSLGAYDMVGNVWEWVDETVQGRTYADRELPVEGYVREADASGVAISTDPESADVLYGKDYFWSKEDGTFGMLRGGFYGSGEDAGLYTINASVPTNFATQGVGFRCVFSV